MAAYLSLPFMTEAAYARRSRPLQRVLYEAQRVEAPPPLVFPEPEPDFCDLGALQYDFPAVTLTTLRDVAVRGRSNILTPPDAIVRHGLMDPRVDLPAEEFYSRLFPAEGYGSAAWQPADPFEVGYLPEAAVFTDSTSFNYAHWLTEVLPRISAFTADGEHAGVPLIVDADLHPNIVRSIGLVTGPDVTLHRLAPDELVRVGVLRNVSPTGYAPFKLRASARTFSHGRFSPQALRAMVAKLRAAVPAAETGRPKLFIRRRGTVRHLVNEAEIEEVLAAKGFLTIEPERLSLEEQIAAYSGAGMVVGATGAAVANLVYCQADCPTVVIMPKFRELAYWYWRRIAAAAGAGPVIYVNGEQVAPLDNPYHPLAAHQDFRVEAKDVLEAVDAADALRR